MRKVINFYLFLILINFGFCANAWSQTKVDQSANRALFNRIEYFFNSGQIDSIYALSADDFRIKLPSALFRAYVLEHTAGLGQIRSARSLDYAETEQEGTYLLEFESMQLLLKLQSAEERRFSNFEFSTEVPSIYRRPEGQAGSTFGAELAQSNSSKARSSGPFAELEAKIEAMATNYVRMNSGRGLAIGLLHRQQSAQYFFGKTNRSEPASPPNEHTAFSLGRGSHIFVATLLGALEQEGLVDSYAPLTRYLPDSLANSRYLQNLTLQQLANHSSGLPARLPHTLKTGGFAEMEVDTALAILLERKGLFDFIANYEPEQAPGSEYTYSEVAFDLLRHILSNLTGRSYTELLNEYVLSPLGLNQTTLIEAHGMPESDVQSSLFDVMRFSKAHFNSPDLPVEYALAATRQFSFFYPPDTDIGLAWHMNLVGDNLIYWYEGSHSGGSVYFAISPDAKKALIILSEGQLSVKEMGMEIVQILMDKK